MDSTNHNNVDTGGEHEKEQQQHKQPPVVPQNAILARGRKRKCQQADDGHDEEEEELLQLQKSADGSKGSEDGYADDMELEGLSREQLIKLLKEAKKEIAAKNNTNALTTKLECQPHNWTNKDVDDGSSSSNIANAQYDSLIQELSRQIAQLREEKEENAKQIDALHIQLKEMRQPQIPLPTQQMKVQLPFENWAELLGFLSRRELGEVVANVGNRHFAWLLQSFLHEYGEITLGSMELLPPDEEFASGRPFIRAKPIYMKRWKKMFFTPVHGPMPENVVNFKEIQLSYFDNSVLNFLHKFKQKALMANVNLMISVEMSMDIVQTLLTDLLPLIEQNIKSIILWNITWSNRFYNCVSGNAYFPIFVKMLSMARILKLFKEGYNLMLDADIIELCCRWLYTPRGDGKSRVLFISRFSKNTAILPFIERIKKDFLAAIQPFKFFILLHCKEAHEELNFENAQTAEKLVIKNVESNWIYNTLLIARHPMRLRRKAIETNVKKAIYWKFYDHSRKITLINTATKVVM